MPEETKAPASGRKKKPATAKKPFIATSLPEIKAWLANEYHIDRLNQILTDPVFLAAAYYAIEELRVVHADLTGPRAKLDAEIVRKASVHAGCAAFLATLKSLPGQANSANAEEPEPWGHVK